MHVFALGFFKRFWPASDIVPLDTDAWIIDDDESGYEIL